MAALDLHYRACRAGAAVLRSVVLSAVNKDYTGKIDQVKMAKHPLPHRHEVSHLKKIGAWLDVIENSGVKPDLLIDTDRGNEPRDDRRCGQSKRKGKREFWNALIAMRRR